jgi:simple sugar transport system permease protein
MSDAIQTTKSSKNTSSGSTVGEFIRSPAMGAFVGMVMVFCIFAAFGYHRNFLTLGGIANWMNFASTIGIVAIPVGFLMIAGELDISVGAMMPASAMTLGILSGHFELPIALGMIITFGVAALVGLINGLLVTRTKVPSFIVTLATLFAVGGLTLTLSVIFVDRPQIAYYAPDWAMAVFGERYFGFRAQVFWWLLLTVVFFFVLHKSPWGNWIFAVGGDEESARNAGIPTNKLKISLFIICSVCTAFAGMCQVIQFSSAQSATNFPLIFNTIIACVVGGVVMTGGFGTLVGIFFGTMTLGIVQQGIGYTEIDRNLSSLIIGVMLLLAVLMNGTFQNLATSWSTGKKED